MSSVTCAAPTWAARRALNTAPLCWANVSATFYNAAGEAARTTVGYVLMCHANGTFTLLYEALCASFTDKLDPAFHSALPRTPSDPVPYLWEILSGDDGDDGAHPVYIPRTNGSAAPPRKKKAVVARVLPSHMHTPGVRYTPPDWSNDKAIDKQGNKKVGQAKRESRVKQQSPVQLSLSCIDRKLWAGAAAEGWNMCVGAGQHYVYTSPDGRKFTSQQRAREGGATAAMVDETEKKEEGAFTEVDAEVDATSSVSAGTAPVPNQLSQRLKDLDECRASGLLDDDEWGQARKGVLDGFTAAAF